MERISTNLVVAKDHNGEVGLMIVGTENNEKIDACRIALLIAHDLVEHQNGVDVMGTAIDEFQALGAIQCGRGFGRPLQLWGDIQNTWDYMLQYEETLGEPMEEIECDEREFFEDQVRKAWLETSFDQRNALNKHPDFQRLTVNLMCLGYNKSLKRFNNCRLSAYDAYVRMERKFEEFLEPYMSEKRWAKVADLTDIEGQQLIATYSTDGQFAEVQLLETEND